MLDCRYLVLPCPRLHYPRRPSTHRICRPTSPRSSSSTSSSSPFTVGATCAQWDDATELDAWWSATSALIPANSRVGSIASAAIGSVGADPDNVCEQHFHEWLLSHSLHFPQTTSLHIGSHATWHHPAGGDSRSDYIAVSQDLLPNVQSTDVMTEFDISASRPDHEPVHCQLDLALRDPQPAHRQRGPLRPCSATLPPITWSLDVHVHAAVLQQQIFDLFHAPAVVRPRKPHMSGTSWGLVRQKRWSRNRLRTLQRQCCEAFYARF